MEIRLCSIRAAVWLAGLDENLECSSVKVPKGFGLSIENALRRGLRRCRQIAELKLSGPIGVVVAKSGVGFQSEDFVASVAHALACGSVFDSNRKIDIAEQIEAFIFGRNDYGTNVPPMLKTARAYSVLNGKMAVEFATWIEAVDRETFLFEVADMHGGDSLADFASTAKSLAEVFGSIRIHGCDLCCCR